MDLGAAESVVPYDMLEEIQICESAGSKAGLSYIVANGGRMPNLGERHVRFKTKDGLSSSVLFQNTHARKTLAAVSRIVQKCNKVVFSPGRSYIENIRSGQKIDLVEAHHMDVDFITEGFGRLV